MITIQQQAVASGSSNNLAVSFPVATTAGNGIVVVVNYGNATLNSVDDSGGNGAYTQARQANFFGAVQSAIYYFANPAAALTVTAHFSGAVAAQISVYEVVGDITVDDDNGASGNATNPQTGSVTTTDADTVIFSSLAKSGSVITPPVSFGGGYTTVTGAAAYRVLTATDTVNPQWTTTAGTPFAGCTVAFSSSVTDPPNFQQTSSLLQWSQTFLAEPFVANVMTWSGSFHFPEVPAADAEISDTLTWTVRAEHDLNLTDSIVWSGGADGEFYLPYLTANQDDTLYWSDSFQADINLLAVGRYRR